VGKQFEPANLIDQRAPAHFSEYLLQAAGDDERAGPRVELAGALKDADPQSRAGKQAGRKHARSRSSNDRDFLVRTPVVAQRPPRGRTVTFWLARRLSRLTGELRTRNSIVEPCCRGKRFALESQGANGTRAF